MKIALKNSDTQPSVPALAALPSASLSHLRAFIVANTGYIYHKSASRGDFQPDDAPTALGWWLTKSDKAKGALYYLVENDYDFVGNAATDVSSIENFDMHADLPVYQIKEDISTLIAAAGGFGSLTAAEKLIASKWFAVDKSDRDTVSSDTKQETNAALLVSKLVDELRVNTLNNGTIGIKAASSATVDLMIGAFSRVGQQAMIIQVNNITDLPAPSGGKHVLEANTAYFFNTSINIAGNYIECGDNTTIQGNSTFLAQIIYTGTGAAIRGVDVTVSISHVTFIASGVGASVFSFTNAAKDKNFIFRNSAVTLSTEIGTISGYKIALIQTINHSTNLDGWTFDAVKHLFFLDTFFDSANGGTYIDLPTGTFDDVIMARNRFDVPAAAIGLAIDAETITVTNNISIISNIISGVGTHTTGFTVADLKFDVKMNFGIVDFVSGASMTWSENTGTMTLGSAAGWTKITGGTSLGTNLKRFTHTSPNKLTYVGLKTLLVSINVSLAGNYVSGGAFVASISVFKNGTLIAGSENGFTIYSADEPCSTNKQVSIEKDDDIEVFVKKFVGPTTTISFGFFNVQINELS